MRPLVRTALAAPWFLLGVLALPSALESLPVAAGQPLNPAVVPSCRLLSAAATLVGIAVMTTPRRVASRLGWVGLVGAVVLPLLGELAVRASLRFEGSPMRLARRYGHNLVSDDYWILLGRWSPDGPPTSADRVHARLGWSQTPITPENPLGLLPRTRTQLVRDGRPKVLFYGDSYVAGHSAEEDWIPNWLDDRLQNSDVVHLGVGGYGTDQIHLLMAETLHLVAPKLVVQSAMVYDFDRATLSVRSYQKPLFRLESGRLQLTNVPVHPDPTAFFATAGLSFKSFLGAAVTQKLFPTRDPRFNEKVALNDALLDAGKELVQAAGAAHLFVLFHTLDDLLEPDWRSHYFERALAERRIECFDTRGPLLEWLQLTGRRPGELYVDGHHNGLGNQVIGEALLGELRRRGFE